MDDSLKRRIRIATEDARNLLADYRGPIKATAKALEIAGQIKNAASPLGIMTSALGGVSAFLDSKGETVTNGLTQNYFTRRGWVEVCGGTSPNLLRPVLKGLSTKPVSAAQSFVTRLDGIPLGMIFDDEGNLWGLFCPPEEKNAFWVAIGKRFLELFPGVVVLKGVDNDHGWFSKSRSHYELALDDKAVFHTAMSKKIAERVKNYNDRDVPRSILLHGPPGTGKTTIGHAVVEKLGLRAIRGVSKKFNLPFDALKLAVQSLRMDAVLIDDIDRMLMSDELLEFMEWARDHTKLVIYTANDEAQLTLAARRPGRIDEKIRITALPEETVKVLLGPDNIEYFDSVKNWPVAYINEFVYRRGVSSDPEQTKAWIDELTEEQTPKKKKEE